MRYFIALGIYYFVSSLFVNTISTIYVPNDGTSRIPAHSSGVKTASIKHTPAQNIFMHHNYSHVNYQNTNYGNALTQSQIRDGAVTKLYPVYKPDLQINFGNNQNGDRHLQDTNQKVIVRVKKQLEVYDKCPSGATGQFVYSLACNQFLNCWKGRGVVQNCGPGTLFNPDTLTCDFPDKVRCVTGPRQTMFEQSPASIAHTVNTRDVQPNCPKEFSGRMPNYSNCTKFIVCMQGVPMNQMCPPGTLFDTNRNICNYPQLARCFNGENHNSQDQDVQYFVTGASNRIDETNSQPKYKPMVPTYYETHYEGADTKQISSPYDNQQVGYKVRCSNSNDCRKPFATHLPTGEVPQGSNCGSSNCLSQNQGQIQQNGYGYQNLGTQQLQNCFPPNCIDNNSNRPAYPQRNHLGRDITQSINCNPSDVNCRRQYTSSPSGGQSRPRYPDSSDLTPGASNTRIVSQCNPNNPNCGSSTNQYETPNYSSQNADGASSNTRIRLNYGQQTVGTNQQSGRCQNNQNCGDNQSEGQNVNQNSNPSDGQFVRYPNTPQNRAQNRPVKCPNGAMGLQPHPYDCSKFLNCANGQTFVQSCGPGTLYSPQMMTCDFDYNVECNQKNIHDINSNSITPSTNQHEMTTSYTYLTPNYDQSSSGHYVTQRPTDTNPGFHQFKPNNQGTRKPPVKTWPPPFTASDPNDGYIYDYYEANVQPEVEPKNAVQNLEVDCQKDSFDCRSSQRKCIAKNLVCDGQLHCANGKDEEGCNRQLENFELHRNARLASSEKERWDNTSATSCAYLCLNSKQFDCKSFSHRNNDNCCLLSDANEGMTGRLTSAQPYDYYERKSSKLDCSNMFKCNNNKCVSKNQLCDGQNDCGEMEDEKNCPADKIGYKINLKGGKNPWEGIIEVTAFNRTGFVCDDHFDRTDADVACKELGYQLGAVDIEDASYFGQQIPPEKVFYLMDDVKCQGNEKSIRNCDFNGWGSHDCTPQEMVGLICNAEQTKCPDDFWKCESVNECLPMAFVCDGLEDCSDGADEAKGLCEASIDLRLVNGPSHAEGRIEVKYHGVWGTVCDDDFSDDSAKVVCKYLGFKGTVAVKKDSYFGKGSGPIWLDQVACFGNETNLEQCPHWNWGENNCDHSEDVGVICTNSDTAAMERHQKKPQHLKTTPTNSSPVLPIYPSYCGLRKNNLLTSNNDVHFRVVKGSKAKKGDFPWQAALRVQGKIHQAHWCGAVVISSKFVLTAAHCLVGYPKGAYIVVAGDYNVEENEGTEQYAYIEDFYTHEDFRKGHKMNNDIALIKLKGNGLALNQDVQPICLPDADTNYDVNLNCTISGYGSVGSGESVFSNELRAGEVPLLPESVCKMPHVYGPNITDGMICAGSLEGGTDSCDGDSGGPLACLDKGFYTLYGIVSWGQRCGYANKPGVYVKVAHYKKWIDDTIRKNT